MSKLSQRRELVNNQITDYLKTSPTALNINTLEAAFLQDLSSKDFAAAINNLRLIHDLDNNITTRITPLENGEVLFIRDARNQKNTNYHETQYSYQMQSINHLEAALKIAELEGKTISNEIIKELTKQITLVKNGGMAKEFNTALASTLDFIGVVDATVKLDEAKSFTSFKNPTENIVTISSIKGQSIIERSIVTNDLTEEQKEVYINIRDNKLPLPEWFNNLFRV